jgi:amino acid transporter
MLVHEVKGLGPAPGIAAGWSVVIGYAAAAMASVLGAGSYLSVSGSRRPGTPAC